MVGARGFKTSISFSLAGGRAQPEGRWVAWRTQRAVLLVAFLALGSLAASVSELRPVAAAADPVVAAAGDIACDPADAKYNSGNGVLNYCQQKAVSNLLVNGNFSAVLSLGDNQYSVFYRKR